MKKKMIPLTDEENRYYEEQEVCHICKKKFYLHKNDEDYENKNRLKITVISQENLEELLIAIAI